MNHSIFTALRGSWRNGGGGKQTPEDGSVPNGKATCLVKTEHEGPGCAWSTPGPGDVSSGLRVKCHLLG